MMTIDLAEKKSRFSEMLDRVERGETISVSRNGQAVAELRPAERLAAVEPFMRISALCAKITKRNAGRPPWPEPGKRLRDVIHEGHQA
jgi:antitoxin (DNA-binding transcriptional repressor) of toxin-antitoxin stability system